MQKNSNIICDSYLNMTAASSHYQDNWICDETWFRLLNAHYPHLKNTFNFTREGLNRALSAKAGPFTGPNEFGVFSVKFRTECPYSGERRRVSYFYRQVNGKPPADPVSPLDITDELSKSNSLCMRLSRATCMRLGRGVGWHAKKGRPILIASLQNASRGTSSRRIGFVSSVNEHVVTCSPILHCNSFTRTKVRSRS